MLAFVVLVSLMVISAYRVGQNIKRIRLRAFGVISDPGVVENYDGSISYPQHEFSVLKSAGSGKPRLGLLKCPHGEVETPNFVFCATKAAMKAVTPDILHNEGVDIILSNTYHLMLTPGSELVEKMGGLQKFTAWRGPMLTDSGGYQIFSMGYGSVANEIKGNRNTENLGWQQTLLDIDEKGAIFRSYIDGSIHHLTPERSIEIQRQLGADFIVVLDECTVRRALEDHSLSLSLPLLVLTLLFLLALPQPFNVDKNYTRDSMRRSHRWAKRSLAEFERGADGTQAIYGIIQGGIYQDLRDESIDFVNQNPFFGVAIGGSLGASKGTMHDIVTYTRSRIDGSRPVHLLGIGGVRDIFNGVRVGIDTFDCVHPTRLGRHGGALVRADHWNEGPYEGADWEAPPQELAYRQQRQAQKRAERGKDPLPMHRGTPKRLPLRPREHVNVRQSRFARDPRPIDPSCDCYTCRTFSRAYLHHLFKAKESIGGTLVTTHNIRFMTRLMKDVRRGIRDDCLDDVEREWVHPSLLKELQKEDNEEEKKGEEDDRI